MQISSLQLLDFRNYQNQCFDFDPQMNVFYGNNGRGKTNILEALSILSVGKSWRETRGLDLILDASASDLAPLSAQIKAKTTPNSDTYLVDILPRSRSFSRNEKKVSLKSHIGQIPTLLFCPEFLNLFSGTKKLRLQFFDRFLSQVSPFYRDNLLKATKAHTQKNILLKQNENLLDLGLNLMDQVTPWNLILAETIPLIIAERRNFLKVITPLLQVEWEKISKNTEPVSIELSLKEAFDPTPEGILHFFTQYENHEKYSRRNLIAPNRDDFIFHLRNQPIVQTASRGEERSVLLALLSAQKYFLKQHEGISPILLFDDVFSELDAQRQQHLEALCEGSQSFFTTTHKSHFKNFTLPIASYSL